MKKIIQNIKQIFVKKSHPQPLVVQKPKSTYVDPITGGADMVIVFEKYEDAKWFIAQLCAEKIFGSWFGQCIYFFKKDLETVKNILPPQGVVYRIDTVKYMSVNEAIDKTISAMGLTE